MFAEFKSPHEYLTSRTAASLPDPVVARRVTEIIHDVRTSGDEAIKKLTERLDGVRPEALRVSAESIQSSVDLIGPDVREILLDAITNVRAFHKKQVPESWLSSEEDGRQFGMQFRAIERVGCYVPGGTAGYPSTVIMTVVPAQIAGVPDIVLASPPGKTGAVNPLVLAVAGLLGVDRVYAMGGAQAIAALALGTESVERVGKIVGPGNAYVNEAKRQLFGVVGIDSLAGPTEVVILADRSAKPEYVVRDLFAQAEHDPDSRAILITDSPELQKEVQGLANRFISSCGRRRILEKAIHDHGAIVLVQNLAEGVGLVSRLAPEHVQVMTARPEALLPEIKNAGAICLGEFTPVVVGDYFGGPNHVLPTAGTARFSSPLSVLDFMKFSSVLKLSKERLLSDQSSMAKFAELEGFPNHRDSVQCRK